MKSVGTWDNSSSDGFKIYSGSFRFYPHKIYFASDGIAVEKEGEQLLKAFSKIVPSAVPQIKKSFETGENFSGNYDGWHVQGTFGDIGIIKITN